uniref:Protein JTB n=2 Tax=Timema TaxID=61471 RepID=A0A7R9CSU2_TIMPO|nr:unnamed protein product [Timema douglasi]CAD7401858.1 unnamed protein product [Timema poppensis]
MIESCSKKRMLLAIVLLGGLTLLVLMLESHWTSVGARSYPTVSGKNTSSEHGCWLHEEYQIVEPCHLCTDFEIASKSNFVCVPTHFKEVLQCQISGKASRSCDKVTWLEERNFWIFEGVMFVISVISTTTVFARQKVLDRRMMRRIQRQLANSV